MKKIINNLLLLIVSFIFIGNVNAQSDVKITGLTVEDKTSTISVNSYSYDDLGIKTDIFFNQVGDYVKFKITLKNNDNMDYIISDIQSNYNNEFTKIEYEYENNNKEFKANSTKTLFVTFKYIKEATNITTLNSGEIKITIPLDITNPKTGPERTISVLIIGLALGIIMYIYTKQIRVSLSVMLAITLLGTTIYVVNAAQKLNIDINVEVTMDAPTTGKAIFDKGYLVQAKMFELSGMDYEVSDSIYYTYLTCYNDESPIRGTASNNYNNSIKKMDAVDLSNNDPEYDDLYTCTDKILKIERSSTIDDLYKNDEHKISSPESDIPIYMWYDENTKTIYWYTEAPMAYLNENAENMFANLEYLNSLDLSDIRTRYTTNMYGLFAFDRSITSLDVTKFDTSNVSQMGAMFYNMKKLESINVSNFDTSNVEEATNIFFNDRSLVSLDLSSWNTTSFKGYSNMFEYLVSLSELDISSFMVTIDRELENNLFDYLPVLQRIKTPKIFNVDYYIPFDGVFTDGTNNYNRIDSTTPISTWLEKTQLLSFSVKDLTKCNPNNTPTDTSYISPLSVPNCINGYPEYTLYAEEGMTWREWLRSNYNLQNLNFTNHDECHGPHFALRYYGISGTTFLGEISYEFVNLDDRPIKNGIYDYIDADCSIPNIQG